MSANPVYRCNGIVIQQKEWIEKVKECAILKINFLNLNGRVMTHSINPLNIESMLKYGSNFDASSTPGIAMLQSSSDRVLRILPESLCTFEDESNDDRIAWILATIWNDIDHRSSCCPRYILEQVVERARKKGYTFGVGSEYEFFLFTNTTNQKPQQKSDSATYSVDRTPRANATDLRTDPGHYFFPEPLDDGDQVRNEICKIMGSLGHPFEKSHHECVKSQHEISLKWTNPVDAADRFVLFSYLAKKVAARYGMFCSFMAKPFSDENRSGFNIHLSCFNDKKENVFYDKKAPNSLSSTFKKCVGGVIKYCRDMSLVMASTVNSYKAYIPEKEAPVKCSWGFKSRGSYLRVPYVATPEGTRFECRGPSADCNAYLSIAALIHGCMKGIDENLDCGPPDSEDDETESKINKKIWDETQVPKSLYEALLVAERGNFLRDLFGNELYDNYVSLKLAEWEEYRTFITDWEIKRYLTY